jgi:NitT/TauT family transport system substrate-binding protein
MTRWVEAGFGTQPTVLDQRTCRELGALPLPARTRVYPSSASRLAEVGYIRLRLERVGVRGFGSLVRPGPPHPPRCARRPLPFGERWSTWHRLAVISIASILSLLFTVNETVADTLRVGKAGREAFSFVPADIGARTGIFKKNGVEIEISSFGGDARIQQAMAADGIDVALGSGPGLAFIVKGSPVKGIAAMAGPPLLFALVVRNDDAVKTADDLKGRKVGVSTVGSVTSWIIIEVSRQQGWGYDGIAQVPIGDDANRIAALKTRSVDGAIVNLAQALNFVQRGEGRVLLRFGELVKDFHIHVIFATDQVIAQKPEALRGFLKGWLETIAFMRQHKAETVAIAKEVMGTDAPTASGIYDELMPMFSDTGRFDPKALAVLRKSFVEMKTLPEEPDMARLYTEAFLPRN